MGAGAPPGAWGCRARGLVREGNRGRVKELARTAVGTDSDAPRPGRSCERGDPSGAPTRRTTARASRSTFRAHADESQVRGSQFRADPGRARPSRRGHAECAQSPRVRRAPAIVADAGNASRPARARHWPWSCVSRRLPGPGPPRPSAAVSSSTVERPRGWRQRTARVEPPGGRPHRPRNRDEPANTWQDVVDLSVPHQGGSPCIRRSWTR
jgi:hypothetical protein